MRKEGVAVEMPGDGHGHWWVELVVAEQVRAAAQWRSQLRWVECKEEEMD